MAPNSGASVRRQTADITGLMKDSEPHVPGFIRPLNALFLPTRGSERKKTGVVSLLRLNRAPAVAKGSTTVCWPDEDPEGPNLFQGRDPWLRR
jgi:hypothetical protein